MQLSRDLPPSLYMRTYWSSYNDRDPPLADIVLFRLFLLNLSCPLVFDAIIRRSTTLSGDLPPLLIWELTGPLIRTETLPPLFIWELTGPLIRTETHRDIVLFRLYWSPYKDWDPPLADIVLFRLYWSPYKDWDPPLADIVLFRLYWSPSTASRYCHI